jgi:hypothetical protein
LGTGAERIKFWSRISRGEVCSRKFVLNKILWNRELYNGIVRVNRHIAENGFWTKCRKPSYAILPKIFF